MAYGYFNVWNFNPVIYIKKFTGNYKKATAEIEATITMFFPEKSATISQELSANNKALLHKLLRCIS